MRRGPTLAAIVAGAVLAAAGCGGDDARRQRAATRSHAEGARPAPPPALAPEDHLRALARLTRSNGGTRAAGTPGYEAAVRYVSGVLDRARYRVTRQPVRFPFFDERSPPRLSAGGRAFRRGRDFRAMVYSGAGTATGLLRPIRLAFGTESDSGCAAGDFSDLRRGEVALIQRGTCTLRTKAVLAERAGAAAALIANDGRPGRTAALRGTLGSPGVGIPVLSLSTATGRTLASGDGSPRPRVRVRVDAASERRSADTVLAQWPGDGGGRFVLVGAHLDSVIDGPGINDDGSGVAALLSVAQQRPGRSVRFAFWAAEELGLHGSRQYVRSLARADRRRIAAYVNLDMVASPNPSPQVYGTHRVDDALRRAVRATGRTPHRTELGGASDHAPFARAGIPVGGLFTGGSETGRDGKPRDPCYHRACDDLDNANLEVLADMTAALERALRDRVLDRPE
jgi:hypothetical protein